MELEIEHRDLGDAWVEGVFLASEVSQYLALQTGIPRVTIRARIIEAYGYCERPPKNGKKVMFLQGSLYAVDDQAIRAMQRVVFDYVTANEVEAIVTEYLADENGDAFTVAFRLETHPYIVVSTLNCLRDKGRLPAHPSWL